MKIPKLRIQFVFLVVIAVGVLLFAFSDFLEYRNDATTSVADARDEEWSGTSAQQDSRQPPTGDLIDQPSMEPPQDLTDSQEEWLRNSGFTDEYNRYFLDREFLEQEAAYGNHLALTMLGRQMLGTEKGNEYLTDAAILGSIRALHVLSESSKIVAEGRLKTQREKLLSEEDQHENAVRALEYLFVAELRGDNFVAPNSIMFLMKDISYSEDDIEQACLQSKETYRRLEAQRMAQGLPNFDNVPAPDSPMSTKSSSLCKN